MRISEQPLHCIACKHEWLGEVLVDAPVDAALAVMRSLSCPACGASAKKVAFGRGDVPNPEPVVSEMTDGERRQEWLKLHDSGLSSCCIADVMCGMPPTGNYPHDGDDFGRCERLLMRYPQWRSRLSEMASVNAQWAALAQRWDEIVVAWAADVAASRAGARKNHKWVCYPLMRSILESTERARSAA